METLIKREQIAGMNIHYMRYSLEYFLDAQERAGIKTIEFWTGVPHYYLDSMKYGDCKALKRKIQSHGLEVKVFTPENCIYQYQYAAKKKEIFESSLKYFENGIYAAAELGCKILQCNSGWGYLDETREEAWKRSAEMLARLCETAQKEGILLAMETLRPEESNLVIRLEDAIRMKQEINQDNFKILVDTTAIGVAGETLQQWIHAFGPDIVHMHFIDGNPYGHLIWGDGCRDLKEYLTVLKDNGYYGYLGQEITGGQYLKDPFTHDLRNMKAFEQYMK